MSVKFLILVLTYFLSANLMTVIILKKTFGKCLPITMMGNAFMLFFSQILFSTFQIGFYGNILYAVMGFLLLIFKRKEKSFLKSIKENYFTSGLLVFIIITLSIFVFDFKRTFNRWDEYSHWGEMLKEMFRLDSFYTVSESVLQAHKDYPPLLQLFELFVIKLGGTFKETYAIFALHLLEISLFIPTINEVVKSKKKNIFLSSICLILLFLITTLFFDQHQIVNNIYNDYFMAILVAYALFVALMSKEKTSIFTITNLTITLSFLLLTKQIGLTLFLMVLFFYYGSLIIDYFNQKHRKVRKENILNILKTLVIVIVPICLWLYWGNLVKNVDTPIQFNLSDIHLSEVYKIARNKEGSRVQTTVSNNFISNILERNLTTSYIHLSYFPAVFVMLLLIYLIYRHFDVKNIKKYIKLLFVTLIIGAIGYAFVMYCTYVFCFEARESLVLTSFERYIPTYNLIVAYLTLMLFLFASTKKDNIQLLVFATIILLSFTNPKRTFDLIPKIFSDKETKYEAHAHIIKKYVEPTSKVHIIAQDSFMKARYFIKYYASPIMVNVQDTTWNLEGGLDYEKNYEIMKKNIINYDYLYIASIDDEFVRKYSFAFPVNPQETQLYKIEKTSKEDYSFILVE